MIARGAELGYGSQVAALETADAVCDVAPPSRSSLRPTNLARSAFHVGSGAFAMGLIRLMPSRGWLIAVAGAFAVSAWTMEIARRRSPAVNDRLMRLFGPVAHAAERHRVNSSTWYVTALVLLSTLAPLAAAELGVLVLAIADPCAGLIGRRFGRTTLRAGRSLEGTLGFVCAGALASMAWLGTAASLPVGTMLAMAFAASTAGALAELGSTKLDDNFTIPIVATAAVAAVQLTI